MLALKNVKSKFRATYDSNNNGLFTVHKPIGKVVQFNIHKDGLHYYDTKNRNVTLV